MNVNSKSQYLAILLAGSPDHFWESLIHDLTKEIADILSASTFISVEIEHATSQSPEDLLPSITTMNELIEARSNRLFFMLEAASEYRLIQK